ncbi:electron transfer flavoprotein subunit alpha/FixB family protein [Desulfitobacterium chlororespirans]|uniref:Electron transfer flavoprotein alpha subunit apoprotein n=1 Tax=Desulfitobacterium chlororespirans DSM 11544 TaxID=1121395 RepID=A0A1M7SF89_9FIRM|nr:FAD-binding protein [Desulfitobacterium chlororespirans]SHN57147.1 electron transfer flavoprotein alpha subunit apoprotein [Desulfitobacterium chlororespirans DSM 11544]
MSKLACVWVIGEEVAAINELTAGARTLGDETAVLFAGDKDQIAQILGADKVYYLGPLNDKILENYKPAIINLVAEKKPNLLLIRNTKRGRLIAGALAANCGTNVLTDITEIVAVGNGVETQRMVYGGAAFRKEKSTNRINIACVGAGLFQAGDMQAVPSIIDVDGVTPDVSIKCLEKKAKGGEKVNLAAAKRVVGVGRGLKAAEDLKMIEALAVELKAELGCSRPIAEEEKWMAKERYIGVSGVMLKPEVYIALGISGQVQHTVGINQAKTILAIDKDKNAPIFKQADYGIVGDMYKVVPALIDKFRK